MAIVRTQTGGWHWLGATAVSTGKMGRVDHFHTPLGVFVYTPDNPDFRAEPAKNACSVRTPLPIDNRPSRLREGWLSVRHQTEVGYRQWLDRPASLG